MLMTRHISFNLQSDEDSVYLLFEYGITELLMYLYSCNGEYEEWQGKTNDNKLHTCSMYSIMVFNGFPETSQLFGWLFIWEY